MELSLIELKAGEVGRIARVEGGYGMQRRIAALGIRIGKSIKKIASEPLRGPIVLEVDGTQVAIGRGMAMKIFIEVKR